MLEFQHTAARRRLLSSSWLFLPFTIVSTHSRAEAAAKYLPVQTFYKMVFQHTAARRRLRFLSIGVRPTNSFNTQPRGGGCSPRPVEQKHQARFQHTAARRRLRVWVNVFTPYGVVSTHSRAEAAAIAGAVFFATVFAFQHTAARRRLQFNGAYYSYLKKFQHTAARRRLLALYQSV